MSNAAQNTDREIWREIPGDFYSPSIHITKENGLGLNVGGLVYVMPVRAWHALRQQLAEAERQRDAHADLACEWRRELGALRQQLEQSQQLVTDGQEAIGHWQGEYEQLRQRVQELETPLCIGQPTIEILATTGEYRCEQGGGLIAADDLFHHSPYQELATAQARILELEQALRLHLAVAKDDPIILTPIEQQLAEALARIHELETR